MTLTFEQRRLIGAAFIKHTMKDPLNPPQGPGFTDYPLLIEALAYEEPALAGFDWYHYHKEVLETITSLVSKNYFKVIDYKGTTWIALDPYYDTDDLKEDIRRWLWDEMKQNSKVKVHLASIDVRLMFDDMEFPEFGEDSYEKFEYKPRVSKVSPEHDDLIFKLIRNTARNKGFTDEEINSFLKIYDALQEDEDYDAVVEPVEDGKEND